MITTEHVFWVQIGTVVPFIITLFVLYRTFVQQKDATIQLLKEKIDYLKDQLTEAKSQSPDVLAQSLTSRIKYFEEELLRLEKDKSSTEEQVSEKENELRHARQEAEDLTKKVLQARSFLSDFLCPHCGAPMSQKEYHPDSGWYQGREIDYDHEYTAYECGYEIMDGTVVTECKKGS